MNENLLKEKTLKTNKGITLIALVITIIVMLILAGVSISLVLDENNGIIKRSQVATNAYADAKDIENATLQNIETKFGEYLSSLDEAYGTNYVEQAGGGTQNTVVQIKTVSQLKTAEGATVQAVNENENEIIEDDFGNKIKIPAGFGIAADSGTNIKEGIVIEDAFSADANSGKGNQYVWVPVGTVYTNTAKTTTETINLVRRVYNKDTGVVVTEVTDGSEILANSDESYNVRELSWQHTENNGGIEIGTYDGIRRSIVS